MRILVGEDEIVRAWMSQKIGMTYHAGMTLGVLSAQGSLIGGVIFLDRTEHQVDIGVAGRGFAYRSVWQAMGDVAFRHFGCVRLQAVTRASNKTVCRLLPRMKFKFEGTMRLHYGNEDGKLFSLLKSEAIALGYYTEPAHA